MRRRIVLPAMLLVYTFNLVQHIHQKKHEADGSPLSQPQRLSMFKRPESIYREFAHAFAWHARIHKLELHHLK